MCCVGKTCLVLVFGAFCCSAQFYYQQNHGFPSRQFNPVVSKSLTCEEGAFAVHMEFKYPFYGMIYTENSHPRCVYVEGRRSPQRIYDFTVPTSDHCGTKRTETSDLVEFKNTLMVQRDPLFIEKWDNSFTLLCQKKLFFGSDDGHFQTIALDKLKVLGPTEETIKKVVETGRNNKIKFSGQLLLGSGTEGPEVRNQVVQLGQRLTYVFRCNLAQSHGEDCAISECYARDETGLTTVQLSDGNGCSLHPSFWSDFQQISDSDLERVFLTSIWAWSFPSSDHVLISCRLRVCNGFCDREECPASIPKTQEHYEDSPLAIKNNFTEEVSQKKVSQFEALTGFSVRRDRFQSHSNSSPTTTVLSPTDNLTYCVGKSAFTTVVIVLMTTLAVMTSAVCLLLWKLHRLNVRLTASDCSSEPFYSF